MASVLHPHQPRHGCAPRPSPGFPAPALQPRGNTSRKPRSNQGLASPHCAPLQAEILGLEVRIDEARRRAWNTNFTPSWFVFFRTQQAAAMAASTQIYGEDGAKFQASRREGVARGSPTRGA